jgi:hypothetical protein
MNVIPKVTGPRPAPMNLSGPANPAPSAAPDIIPFTRPRAISSLPVQFAPVAEQPVSRPTPHPHLKPKNPTPPQAAPIPFPVQARAVPPPKKSAPAPVPFFAQPAPAPIPMAHPAQGSAPVAAPTWNVKGAPATNPFAMGTPYPPTPPTTMAALPKPPVTMMMPAPTHMPAYAPPVAAFSPAPPAPRPDPTIFDESPTTYDAGAQIAAHAQPSRWASFEKLGLVAKKLDPKSLSKHVVTAYRLLGFSILTIIVIVLVGYITQTAFFYFSDSWVVPAAVSPTDEKVLSLQAQLSERQNQRDRIAADLAQAERAIAVQQQFQDEFAKAIKSDLDGRRASLAKMHELANTAASTRQNIRSTNSAYAAASRRMMQQEWRAGLIDRNQMMSGNFQLAQITTSNLSLAERQAEYETRAADLEAQTRSLEALLANTPTSDVMSYDVLKIKQEYETSRLETQKAIDTRDMLKQALAREDAVVDRMAKSSYLRAIADHAEVAFVPYSNLKNVSKGTGLYGCSVGMFWCHKVGEVLEVLPGEVQFKHPHKDKTLRGQMVELRLVEGENAADDVLFIGKPFLL